jgi:nucleotide-binding universal stress UspA family protein
MLLPITGTAGDDDALSFAIQLAASRGAHLTVAVPVDLPLPMPSPWGITPDPLLSEMHQRLRDEASAKADRWRERLRRRIDLMGSTSG